MAKIWANGSYGPLEKLVLLALADWINPATGYCWPKVATIAKKTGLSTRQVQRIISKLKRDGTISVEPGSGRGHASRYRLHLKADSQSPQKKGVTVEAERVTGEEQKGDWLGTAIKEDTLGFVKDPPAAALFKIPEAHPEKQLQPPPSENKLIADRLQHSPDPNCQICGGMGRVSVNRFGNRTTIPCQCRSPNPPGEKNQQIEKPEAMAASA